MTTPVVGITLGPERREGKPDRLIQHRSYVAALERAGAVPLPLPLLTGVEALRRLYRACDGLLLPGGPDIAPERYGEGIAPGCEVVWEPDLDRVELQLLEWALADDLPVLGICRGMQLLNVSLSGTLWQDLAHQRPGAVEHRPADGERYDLTHSVTLQPGTRLAAITGTDRLQVNSLHHQGLRRVAPGLRASGHSEDGLVEAVEMPGRRWVLAVQAHPEELSAEPGWAASLFEAFVTAAGRAAAPVAASATQRTSAG